MAKFLKIIGALLGIVIVLLILAFVLLVTFVSPNRFKPAITEHVKKSTGRDLTIDGDLSWTVFPYLGVKVGHASLSNPSGFKQPIFVEISQATVAVKFLPLMQRKIESRGITLSGMKLNLIKNSSGKTNWEFEGDTSKTPAEINKPTSDRMGSTAMGLVIRSMDISDANISWIDEQAKKSADIKNFAFHAKTINMTEPFPVSVDFDFDSKNPNTSGHVTFASNVAFSLTKQIYSLRDVELVADILQANKKINTQVTGDLVADLSQQTVQWTDFKAKVENVTVTGKVNVAHLNTAAETTGHFDIQPFDLKEWLEKIGQANANLQMTKNVSGTLDFNTSAQSVKSTGNFKVEELQAAKMNMKDVNVKVNYLDGVVDVTRLTASLYKGNLDATAKVNLNTPAPQISSQGKLSGIEAEPLMRDLNNGVEQKIKVVGVGNVDFQITTAGKDGATINKNLNGTGKFSFNNGVVEGIDIGYYIDSAYALASQKSSNATNSNKTSFGTLTGSVQIHNGVVSNNDLLLDSPRFDTKGKGTIDLVNQTIDYSIQTSVKQNQVSTVKNFSGFTIPIHIAGSLSDPKISLDSGAILKDVAKQQVEKHKEQIQQKIQEKLPAEAGKLLQNLLGH